MRTNLWNDKETKRLVELRDSGMPFLEIAEIITMEFGINRTRYSCKNRYERFLESDLSEDALVKNLVQKHSAQKRSRNVAKENKLLIESSITYDDFMENMKDMIASQKVKKVKISKLKRNKKLPQIIIEPLLSDIHIGLKTKTFDVNVVEKRMDYYAQQTIKIINQKRKSYNINKIQIPMLGDLIQSALHKAENSVGAYLTNAQQMTEAVRIIFYHFIIPIAKTGQIVKVLGLPGNHDRDEVKQPTDNPGITYLTWTMYSCIQMLAKQTGLSNVSFCVPNDHFHILDNFGFNFLYTHGYTIKSNTSKSLEDELSKRSAQNDLVITGIRSAHYHTDSNESIGRLIKNGGFPTDDHFGNLLGYKSRACQVINFYIDGQVNTSYDSSYVVNFAKMEEE